MEPTDGILERSRALLEWFRALQLGEGYGPWVLVGTILVLGGSLSLLYILYGHFKRKSASATPTMPAGTGTRYLGRQEMGPAECVGLESQGELGGEDLHRPQGEVSTWTAVAEVEEEKSLERYELGAPDRFWERLRGKLAKTQDQLVGRIDRVLSRRGSVGQDLLEELEEVLLTADLGVKATGHLMAELQTEMSSRKLTPEEVKGILRERIEQILRVGKGTFDPDRAKPFLIMVVGVNGVGKTTTIGKLAARLGSAGSRRIMLVAADTFRPAAIEQLSVWSRRVHADFIRHQEGSDPSAVVYDGIRAACSRGLDVVLVDTAGRLHTKAHLIEELKKIKRVAGRELEGAPHEVLLVLDATTGQNAIHQARIFHESLGVTGIVLTKLDGTAKGGIIVAIAHELGLPVRFIGLGEQIEDLRDFDHRLFSSALFGEGERELV